MVSSSAVQRSSRLSRKSPLPGKWPAAFPDSTTDSSRPYVLVLFYPENSALQQKSNKFVIQLLSFRLLHQLFDLVPADNFLLLQDACDLVERLAVLL
jgi:hypothetical protein